MSSQAFTGGGGGDTTNKAPKGDAVRASQMSHLLNIQQQSATGIKPGIVGTRPIAPSPVQVSATQLIASQTFPNIQSNVQLLGSTLGGTGDQSQQQIKNQMQIRPVGKQSQPLIHSAGQQNVGHSNMNQSQALIQTGAGMHSAVSQSQSLIQGSSGGIIQPQLAISQNVMIPRGLGVGQASMASLIRTGQVQVSQAVTQPQTTTPTQTFQAASHLPRGQAQVSALNQHKPSPVASPMIRPNHTPVAGSQNQPASGQTIMAGGVQRAILPVRTHVTSQSRVGGATITNVQTKSQSAHVPTAEVQKVGGSSIQISVQQPARNTPEVVHTRPTLSKLQAKPGHHPQQVTLQQNTQVTQASPKVLMSSQGVVHSAPLTLTQKINLGNLSDQVRLGLLQPPQMLRPQKHGQTTNVPVVHSTSQTTGLALNQAGMARAQKIIVPQSSNQQNLSSGTIITTVARTAGTGMNLGIRPQKVVVSHITMSNTLPTASHATHKQTVTSVLPPPHKPINHPHKPSASVTLQGHAVQGHAAQVQGHAAQGQVQGHAQGASTTTVTTIPIAKVTPQRQPAHVLHTAMLNPSDRTNQPTNQPASHPTSHPQSHPVSHSVPQTQTGMLLQPRNINATVSGTTQNESTKTITPAAHERQNLPLYNIPPEAYAYFGNLYNQQLQAQAIAAVSSAQLAAASQPHLTSASNTHVQPPTVTRQPVVGQQPGIQRVNPAMMVSVDAQGRVTSHTVNEGKNDGKLQTTMASAHLQNAMTTSHMTQQIANQNQAVPPSNNITASPRPSILRKRNSEGVTMVKRQIFNNNSPNLPQNSSVQQHREDSLDSPNVPAALSPKSSVLDPSRENSQSSTDTASSAESTPKAKGDGSGKHKKEPTVEQVPLENGEVLSSLPNNNNEASPRKKPRKQLLHVNTDDIKADMTDTDEEIEKFSRTVSMKREKEMQEQLAKQQLSEFVDEEGVRWVKDKKRPPIALLSHYQCSWKPKNNHFLRYSDVKPKDERRPTVNELANQKHVHQKCSGWKMYHLAAQVEDLIELEGEVLKKMIQVREQVAPKHTSKAAMDEDLLSMVHELSQGNIQRNRLFIDQMNEAKTSMIKILEHKKRILSIVNKHHSKRPVKKKERP